MIIDKTPLVLDERFERSALEGVELDELGPHLSMMEGVLNRLMREQKRQRNDEDDEAGEAFTAGVLLIDKLRLLGHDLWSWDYDGESVEEWGGDYMAPKSMGRLIVCVHREWRVRVDWLLEDGARLFV